jgi:hypothetical protein
MVKIQIDLLIRPGSTFRSQSNFFLFEDDSREILAENGENGENDPKQLHKLGINRISLLIFSFMHW